MITTSRLYDSHMHTPLCRHASGEISEYAATAMARGLAGVVITCHNPLRDNYSGGVRMYETQFPEYLERIAAARAAFAGRLDILLGLECDYTPEKLDLLSYVRDQLASAPFHYALGSVHCQTGEYRAVFANADPVVFQRTYFAHLADAAETGVFDAISHPDIVKNDYADTWNPLLLLDAIRHALDRIARAGTAMELNTSGLLKPFPEMNPGPLILREMAMRHIPVVLGSDAHDPSRVADHFPEALALLAAAGYREISYFLNRRRRTMPISSALATLRAA